MVSIGDEAFQGTEISGDLIIPSSVESISSHPFSGCKNINRCLCPEKFRAQMGNVGLTIFYPVDNTQFTEEGSLFSRDNTTLYYVSSEFSGAYEIPSSVITIGDYAFAYCEQVASISLPSSVNSIGTACFEGCSGLSGEIEIPTEVNQLKSNVFKNCKKITKIQLHDNIRNIQSEAFSGCTSLKSINLPKEITAIYPGLFNGCSSLDNLNIPENVSIIGNSAFRGCANLKEMILPEGVTNIPQSCFQDCALLNSITLKGDVAEIGVSAFQGCDALKKFVISKSVLPVLEDGNFSETNYQNTLLSIPENMFSEYISSSWCVFRNLQVGEEISVLLSDEIFEYREIPGTEKKEAVLIKGDYNGLHSANIPDRFTDENNTRYYITMIAPEAFKGCTNLNALTFSQRSQIEMIGAGAFSGCTGIKSVMLPSSLVTISDEAFKACSSIKNVSMGSNVKEIGEGVFEGCSSLQEVTLSDNITSISRNLFSGCSLLENIELPGEVTTIGDEAFYQTGLKSLVIPASVENIGVKAFAECNEMTDLEITASPTTINISNDSFNGVTSLRSLKTGRNYTNTPFAESNIEKLIVGNLVTTINESSYQGCKKLAELTLGTGLKSIMANAFSGCHALSELVVSPYVTEIGSSAFAETSLKKISIGYCLEFIGEKAFEGCDAEIIAITSQTPPSAANSVFNDYGGVLLVQGGDKIKDLYYDTDTCWYRFNSDSMIEAERIETDMSLNIVPVIGESVALQATVYPENATLPNIFWYSTNPEIASVDNYGVVKFHDWTKDISTRSDLDGECKIVASTLYYNGPVLEFMVGDNATGINDIHSEAPIKSEVNSVGAIYDLSGRQMTMELENLPKGIYIIKNLDRTYKIIR
ncbi:MAG: leucine-rich repeat protein [Muribaculaceae bacterium]|nr:leucine-rich repeat protein [Muribaculaceae bacterium]